MTYWTIPFIVGVLSAILGYIIKQTLVKNNNETIIRLTSEKKSLQEKITTLETEKDSLHTKIQKSSEQAQPSMPDDAAVMAHPRYTELLAKYQKKQSNNTTVRDSDIQQHTAFLQLKEENAKLVKASQQKTSDESIRQHPVYISLKEQSSKEYNKLVNTVSALEKHNKHLEQHVKNCEERLKTAKKAGAINLNKVNTLHKTVSKLKPINQPQTTPINFSASTTDKTFDDTAAKSIFGKKIKENDLTLIEGIGPKIAELFNQQGINTWQALGAISVEKCQQILDSAGERFKMHTPNTWPRQAQLAAESKWQELYDWQQQLDGGKETGRSPK